MIRQVIPARRLRLRGGLAYLLLASCGPAEPETGAAAPRAELAIEALAAPRALEGAATVWPLRFARGDGARAAWLEELEGRATLAWSAWEGEAFGPAEKLLEGSGWTVNAVDLPAVAWSGLALAAIWPAPAAEPAGALFLEHASSLDGARTWSGARVLHDDRSAVEHGFAALAPLGANAGFAALWLDGRALATGATEAPAATRLYAAELAPDGMGGARGPEVLVDDSVCDCCPLALARLDDGTLVAAYRDRGPGELRDIAVAAARPAEGGRWSKPLVAAVDGWEIAGCPVNGPALAARGATLALAWYTEGTAGAERGPRVQLALSRDAARTFEPALRVDGGRPLGAVELAALSDGSFLVGWLEATAESAAAWQLRRVGAAGTGPSSELAPARAGLAAGRLGLAALEGPGPARALAFWKRPDGTFGAARIEVAE